MANENVLSVRYATPEMNNIFSEKGKILLERELWIAVMIAQKSLGLNILSEDIEKFEATKGTIDLEEIKSIESITKHDVKAKIEYFVKIAGASQQLHRGMTSRDLTDNVEQMQYWNASKLILDRNVSVLRHFVDNSHKYSNYILARTHNQPAQATLLGRRFSMWGEELMLHLGIFENFVENYPLRGIKGAIGTQTDMIKLLGSKEKVRALEEVVAEKLGFKKILKSTGQVYPRSLDYALCNNLAQLSAAPANFAFTMRLMAGFGLVNEGFDEEQSGSSAMPYKMNTRSCERINGFANLQKMYADGASRISGDQWQEGDVSCSAPRRIIGPDSFYTMDGLCETTLTVLNNMKAYEGEIVHELDKYLPFIVTTELMQMATKKGVGREEAHKAIKRHAVAELDRMRREGSSKTNLPTLLANEPIFSGLITKEQINEIIANKEGQIGNAKMQIKGVSSDAQYFFSKYAQGRDYEPRPIL
ncbi:MAG: adenylosuccinate lyase [Nanoarchaeota archaeon]|nr:adenylosuccinate lyase [Nanoarchaeota archaeon]